MNSHQDTPMENSLFHMAVTLATGKCDSHYHKDITEAHDHQTLDQNVDVKMVTRETICGF